MNGLNEINIKIENFKDVVPFFNPAENDKILELTNS